MSRSLTLHETWKALHPFAAGLGGAQQWLWGGLLLSVLTLIGGLGLLGLSGAFLTGAGIAGLSATTAATFNFFMPGAGVRFFAILRTASRWGERVLGHEATFRQLADLRIRLYAHLSRLSPRQLGRFHGADLLHRLMRDIDALDNLYPRLLMPLAAAALVLALLSAMVLWVSPSLIWAPLGWLAMALVVLPLLGWWWGSRLLPAWTHGRMTLRIRLLDTCEGLEDLSHHHAAWLTQRQQTQDSQTSWLSLHLRSQRCAAALRALVVATGGLIAWAALGALGHTAPDPRMSAPWVAALVLLLMGCTEALLPLAGAWLELPGTASAAQRLNDILQQAPETNATTPLARPTDGRIVIDIPCFDWDAHTPVFRDLALYIAAGEHVLLSGESGCGKSTLVQLLTRLEPLQQGHIHIGGVNLQHLDEATLRQQVACALQDTWVQSASLADNLRLARADATDHDMLNALRLVGLDPAVCGWRDGLATWIDEGGANLSGGQRRRLSVARALLLNAPITLLDEPSEGLDAAAERTLMENVTRHLQGRTLVWISHRTPIGKKFHRVIELRAATGG